MDEFQFNESVTLHHLDSDGLLAGALPQLIGDRVPAVNRRIPALAQLCIDIEIHTKFQH